MAKHKDIVITIGFVAIVAVIMVFASTHGPATSANQAASLVDATTTREWATGNLNVSTTLVEYGDFECPACGVYYPLVEKIVTEFGGQLKFVFRDFPLRGVHQNADLAARAAEAAGKQGKFWEMYNALYSNQDQWSELGDARSQFVKYAASIGLNVSAFTSDVDSKDVAQNVENDLESGEASGVNGTPTFFLNGKKLDNPKSYDEFRNIIIIAIGQK